MLKMLGQKEKNLNSAINSKDRYLLPIKPDVIRIVMDTRDKEAGAIKNPYENPS